MSRHFKNLQEEIQAGLRGENGVIPLPLGRLSEYLEISKSTMYTIGAETSGGKTAFTLDQFMIYPLRWYHENKDKVNVKLNILYFCMERSHIMNEAKMISKFIYEDTGILISAKKMVGRANQKLDEKELKLINQYEEYENEITECLKVYEGYQTVESIKKLIKTYAQEHGNPEKVLDDDGKEVVVWKPKHPNHITIIIIDHIGLLGKDKKDIDEFSRIMRLSKDFYKFSPVVLQQLNRDISQSGRTSATSRPKLSDFEGSASTQQDSEVVIALYNPYTHINLTGEEQIKDICGYDLGKLRNDYGIPHYRSVHLLKNTYGGAGLYAGLGFHPPTGSFKEIKKPDEIDDYEYEQITSGRIFTKFQTKLF